MGEVFRDGFHEKALYSAPRDEVSGDVLNLPLASHQMLGLQQEHRIPAHSARSLRCDLWQITVSLEFSVFDYKGRGLG